MRQALHRSVGSYLSVSIGLAVILASLFFGAVSTVATPPPDPVLEWIGIMNDTVLAAGTNPLATSRVVALVSSAVYDAVNGIEPRYRPLYVKPNAPHSASQRRRRPSRLFDLARPLSCASGKLDRASCLLPRCSRATRRSDIGQCRHRLGPDRCRCDLGLASRRWQRSTSASVRRRTRH